MQGEIDGVVSLGKTFHRVFGGRAEAAASAPGRINFIGEHTDYYGGLCLPAAVDRRLYVVGRARRDRRVVLRSLTLNATAVLTLPEPAPRGNFSDYAAALGWEMHRRGMPVRGYEAVVLGNLLPSAGMASSAALLTALASLVARLNEIPLKPHELVALCQAAEEGFLGVRCGIMDHSAAVHPRRKQALLLDCRTGAFRDVPVKLKGVKFLLFDTGIRRDLRMSAYNDRRSEGERAFEQVKRVARKVTHYRDLTPRKLATLKSKLPAPLFQRALHVVEENERVPQAAEALKRGQAKRLGQLLYASHESLSRLYQVSLPEIDALVEASRKVPGVLGLRIMGGGFGGLLLGLLESNKATEAAESLRRIYRRQTRIKGGYFFVGLDGGLKDETLSAAAPLLEPAD